jgi:hypothetical protein
MQSKFQKRVLENLKKYGINDLEEFKKFKYCGGDRSRHLNYWKLVMGATELPQHEDECVCGTAIVENCYITRDGIDCVELLILGNCCIKKFMPSGKIGRTCEDCGARHKNRKINKCNQCKRGICLKCFCNFESDNENRTYCYTCKPSFWRY